VTLEMLFDVVDLARSSAADGLVLTQGTDTLEESAFGLWLLNDSDVHIAATGAMRNPTLPGADGPANVRAAALPALSDPVSDLPASLGFDDEGHDPRVVTKAHATSTAAFSAGPVPGPIGWLTESTGRRPHAPRTAASPFAGLPRPERLKDSALAEVGMGEPEQTLELIAGSGFAGAVISGVGGGHVPESLLPAVTRLVEAMPVVLASRTGSEIGRAQV